ERRLHGWRRLCAVFVLTGSTALAQVDRATLSGIVKDAAGGLMPGATIVVTNLGTNLESRQTTTETGTFQAVDLIPGRYRIDVELTGFKKVSRIVTLEVGQRARLDLTMEAGSFSET